MLAAVEERELWSQGRAEERGAYIGIHKESVSPTSLAWRMSRDEFCKFLQPTGLIA